MKWISVDAMGGDVGPEVTVQPCVDFLHEHEHIGIVLTGQEDLIRAQFGERASSVLNRLRIHPTTETVSMDELPSSALRYKKDSSMRVALNLLKAKEVQATVSAGNTGALMAISKYVLKTVPGISRPAILTRMPNLAGGVTRVLDLGANVDSSPEQLVQFAVMGSIVAQTVGEIERPRVSLLNVGQEEIKGNIQIKKAAELLAGLDTINYIGFVEGDGWFSGETDVVACDGLVGNIALKAVEGISSLIMQRLVGSFKRNVFSQASGLLAKPVLKKFKETTDPRSYNGATLVGLNGVVIKSHGSADQFAFKNALNEANLEIEKQVPEQIAAHIGHLMPCDGN